jgi:hypothetical protein
MTVPDDQFKRLLDFIRRLDEVGLSHRLKSVRPESVCVEVDVPGERWEVEFMEYGGIEIERFRSDGEISDESAIEILFHDYIE